MEFFNLIKAMILGFIEGMTEFAPVSSTGHLIIVDDMWLQTKNLLGDKAAITFKIVIQLGSILAVCLVFWKRFVSLLGFYNIKNHNATAHFNLLHLVIGLLPATILGLIFKDLIDELFNIKAVIVALIIGATLMIVTDKFGPKKPKVISLDQITYKQALVVGIMQCLSLWPGFSRSGATISGGVLLGMSYRVASDFTFIMAVPIMIGASGVSIIKSWNDLSFDYLGFYIAGFISSFAFSLISIRFFLKLISRIKLTPFAVYRIILAIVLAFMVYK
ncbi:undecaprenyl-diphosphate phosphatase [Lysinibacillus sp. NPDC093210]|uniref:undecaprenyl-diphosphate phosphatase n=1 Tax=Lysinibacillus sp. NPDC093210 TaxID=3364133 RepID=UPI003819399B